MGKNVVLKKEVQSRLCLECRWDRGGERAGTPGFEWDHLRIRQSAMKLHFLKSCFCFHDGTLPLQGLHSITSISILQEFTAGKKDQVNYVFIFSFEPTIPPLLWSSCCWWLLTPFLYISRRGSSWHISILPLHAFFANFLLSCKFAMLSTSTVWPLLGLQLSSSHLEERRRVPFSFITRD